jgi:hypothetical protein
MEKITIYEPLIQWAEDLVFITFNAGTKPNLDSIFITNFRLTHKVIVGICAAMATSILQFS